MKPSPLILLACILSHLPVAAQQPGAPPQQHATVEMRDVIGEERLRAMAQKVSLPMAKVLPAAELKEDPTKVNQPEDLVSRSDILSYGGMTTLVPKKAIIRLPESLAQRVGHPDGSRIVPWAEFFAANRGWITTVEITREQARGIDPFSEEMTQSISKASTLVIATFQGGAISVLPPKVQAPASPTPQP